MTLTYIFEMLGTIVFAISGALAAGRSSGKNWFGVLFVGFVTAIGGGSLRDIILGSYPLVWIEDVNFLYAAFGGILLMRIFYKSFSKYKDEFQVFDAMGIALFTVLGTEKALDLGHHILIAAMMGMFTAVMGGVIRDTLTQQTPVIFKKEIYASACLMGAFLLVFLEEIGMGRTFSFIAAGAFTGIEVPLERP